MKISNRWFEGNGDAWTFHIENKNIWRRLIDMSKPDLGMLLDLKFKREWLTDEGEGNPPNMELLLKCKDDYFQWLEDEKIAVPEMENKVLDKAWNFGLSLYRQDSAYFERIGGVISVLCIGPNAEKWVGKTRTERIQRLGKVRTWFKENDKRKRTINWMMWFFDYFIKKYKTDEFYEHSINFLIDWFIAHNGEWAIVPVYNPALWYPAGRGSLNYLVHGREG
jgi:hypothetical protein